jgi:hypothetical protein
MWKYSGTKATQIENSARARSHRFIEIGPSHRQVLAVLIKCLHQTARDFCVAPNLLSGLAFKIPTITPCCNDATSASRIGPSQTFFSS